MPARQIRIFLVRHGQSEANLDKSVNTRVPDHGITLSAEGLQQAREAGDFLSQQFSDPNPNRRLRILCSPYTRTRQTSAGIEGALDSRGIAFDKREAIELRELEFGLFDGIPDEQLPVLYPREYGHYQKHLHFEGEFFAPMPLGESRCQVAERVKGVFGTILRDSTADRERPITDVIVVSHGVTIRCFRMQWMHYPWEWFGQQSNPWNCSVQLIEGVANQGYTDTQVFAGFPAAQRSSQTRREEGVVGPTSG
jgi:2,3-bisphosphoglycerate-dependent phosphoglycerate mutase